MIDKDILVIWERSTVTQEYLMFVKKQIEDIDEKIISLTNQLSLSNEELGKKLSKLSGMKFAYITAQEWLSVQKERSK